MLKFHIIEKTKSFICRSQFIDIATHYFPTINFNICMLLIQLQVS